MICSHRTVQLHITGEYQHLGGLLHHGGDQRKEMKRRLAMAHVSFGEHRKLLFQNQDFPLERRFQLFRTLVLSKLVYGTESWILRTDKCRFGLHCAIIRLYRRLLRAAPDAHLTDDDICSQLGAVSPTVLLRVQRLRYLGLVYKTAGADLWALFLHDKVWIELIRADLRWMYLQLHHSSALPDPDLHFEEWEHILRQYPGFWKRLVNRAGEHSALQMRRKNDVERSLRDMASALRLEDFVEVTSSDPVPEETSYFGCMLCQKACRTKAGEGATCLGAITESTRFVPWHRVPRVMPAFDTTIQRPGWSPIFGIQRAVACRSWEEEDLECLYRGQDRRLMPR